MRPFLLLPALLAASSAALADPPLYPIEIQADRFAPPTLTVPAGVRIKLEVKNTRRLPSEFESFDLNREKVVPPGATVTVWIGPLSPGKYKIFDDFNPGTVGWIVVGNSENGGPRQ
jgi:Cupredoxin-like domain